MYLRPQVFFSALPTMSDAKLLNYIQTWHQQGETPEQIHEYIQFVRGQQPTLIPGIDTYDCSGTGGDGANTFNISTAAAFVASAAGVPIAKHGARRTQGSSGSVDVLEALGLNIDNDPEKIRANLRDQGLAFISSKMSAQFFSRVKQMVQRHGLSSFLSLVGPMSSPMDITGQLLGVGQEQWMSILAEVAKLLERDRVLLAHGLGSKNQPRLDELSILTPTRIIELRRQGGQYSERAYEIDPQQLGIPKSDISELRGGTAQENGQRIRGIFSGDVTGAPLHAVALNSGAVLYLADVSDSLEDGYGLSLEIIRNGDAAKKLKAMGASD